MQKLAEGRGCPLIDAPPLNYLEGSISPSNQCHIGFAEKGVGALQMLNMVSDYRTFPQPGGLGNQTPAFVKALQVFSYFKGKIREMNDA